MPPMDPVNAHSPLTLIHRVCKGPVCGFMLIAQWTKQRRGLDGAQQILVQRRRTSGGASRSGSETQQRPQTTGSQCLASVRTAHGLRIPTALTCAVVRSDDRGWMHKSSSRQTDRCCAVIVPRTWVFDRDGGQQGVEGDIQHEEERGGQCFTINQSTT